MAEQVQEGPYTHMYMLKANFQRAEGASGKAAAVKGEGVDGEDVRMGEEEGSESWDEEDEEELEEVIMR